MNIQGFQKLTLLDFPGKTACTIFTGGCNLRCPFCHNSPLVVNVPKESEYSDDEIISYLLKRKGILEGIAITGGEPLLQPDIKDFIKRVKDSGFLVKLDTNGTLPEKLKDLIDSQLVDYVAMDVKACPEMYPCSVGIGGYDLTKIKQSIEILMENKVDYEFRTTVVNEFHNIDNISKLGELIKGAKIHYLQAFKDSGQLIGFGLTAVQKSDMLKMKDILSDYVEFCDVRGI